VLGGVELFQPMKFQASWLEPPSVITVQLPCSVPLTAWPLPVKSL
jgi:hypothetical protein